MMKKTILIVAMAALLAGCDKAADVASRNLSNAADNFEVSRRVVFYNGITGEYILSVEGLCSIGNDSNRERMSVTCKTGAAAYKKHFLGLSNNVTFFAEQIEQSPVSTYHYRVIFNPSVLIPALEVR